MKKLLTLNQLKSGRRVVCYLLTVMLTLALTLLPQSAWAQEGIEYYGITVGGVEVTSWTVEYGITGENIEGMVTYDSQSNTLTLNGATIKNYSGITCMNDLTILCLGESVVTGDIKSTSTNGATLTLQYGDVDIAASLLYRPDMGGNASGFTSVVYDGMYLAPRTYNAETQQSSGNARGVRYSSARQRFEDEYGNYQSPVYFTNAKSYDLWLGATKVTDANKDNILGTDEPTASFNPTNNTLTLNGMTLTGTGIYDDGIISRLPNLTISVNGDNTIYCNDSCTAIRADMEGDQTLTIVKGSADCSLALQADRTIRDFKTLTITGLSWNKDYAYSYSSGYKVLGTDGEEASYSSSTGLTPILYDSNITPYDLWIAGTQVTSANAAEFSNQYTDGSELISFDATTNTLTLQNATIEIPSGWFANRYPVLSGISGLTIKLVGINYVTTNDEIQHHFVKYSGEATPAAPSLTFATEWGQNDGWRLGSLTVRKARDLVDGYTVTNDIDALKSYIDPTDADNVTTGWKRYDSTDNYDNTTVNIIDIWMEEVFDLWVGDSRVISSRMFTDAGMYNPIDGCLEVYYPSTAAIRSGMDNLTIKVKETSSVGPITWRGQAETAGTLTFVRDEADGDVELTVESAAGGAAISGFSSYSYTNLEPAVSWGQGIPSGVGQSTASKVIITPLAYPLWIGDYIQPTTLTAERWITEVDENQESLVTASFDPKTFRLTLNNFYHDDFSTYGLNAQIMNFGVNLIGENCIAVVEGEQPAMQVGSASENTLTFYTSSTNPGELRLVSRTETITGTGLTVDLENGLIRRDGRYEDEGFNWTNIRLISTPSISAEQDRETGLVTMDITCDTADGYETYYSIDYVSDELQDVTDALYAADASTGEGYPTLLGPCTVTAYTQYGDTKSATAKAKLFGLADSNPSIVYGKSKTTPAPALLPAVEEEDQIVVSYYASPVADFSNIAAIDGETGVITINSAGEVPFVVEIAKPEMLQATGCTVLNSQTTLNFTLTVSAGYNLYVNGIQVTEDNRNNILDDANGSVGYDGGHTLILNNAYVETIETAMKGTEKLNIFLIGENKIGSNGVANAISDRNQGTGSLVFETAANNPGKLTLTSSSNVVSNYRDVEIRHPLSLISPAGGKLIGGTFSVTEAVIGNPLDLIIDDITGTAQTTSTTINYGSISSADPNYNVTTKPLSNIIINNLLYTLNDKQTAAVADDGYYDGQVVLNSTMTDEDVARINDLVVNGILVPGNDDYAGAFKGLTFLVPGGTGTITLTTNTSPGYEFHVKVGSQDPVKVVNKADNTNEVFEMDYAASGSTYVYVYLVRSGNVASAPELASRRIGPKSTVSGGLGGLNVSSSNIMSAPSAPADYMMLDRASSMEKLFGAATRGSHITLGNEFSQVTDLEPGLFSPKGANAPALELDGDTMPVEGAPAVQSAPAAPQLYLPEGITYIDLRQTSIVGMEVSREAGAFKGVPENTFIYMPAGNSIAKDCKNVVIGGICDNVELNASVDAPFELPDDITAGKATLSVDMADGTNSVAICLPYELKNADEYGTFYKLNKLYAGNTALNMKRVKTGVIEANTPCIVDVKAGVKIGKKLLLTQPSVLLKKTDNTGAGLVGVYDSQVGFGYKGGAKRSDSKFESMTVMPFGAWVPAGTGDKLTITWGGDVNNSGSISITDAVGIVNKILNTPSQDFQVDEADVNGDDAITITDAVGVVNIILGQ